MIHALVSKFTARYGGRKSPGRDDVGPQEMYHWTPDEAAQHLAALEADGWHLTVTVLAFQDKRRDVARERYPAPIEFCEECSQ